MPSYQRMCTGCGRPSGESIPLPVDHQHRPSPEIGPTQRASRPRHSRRIRPLSGESSLGRAQAARDPADAVPMVSRRLTILLVEDSQTYGLLATSLLEELGHAVAVATTAEDGLLMARELIPTVILMDINLPGMNGYEAVRQIRQDSLLRYVPVIALTTTEPVNRASIEMGIEAGFTGHTQKPIHKDGFQFLFTAYLGE